MHLEEDILGRFDFILWRILGISVLVEAWSVF